MCTHTALHISNYPGQVQVESIRENSSLGRPDITRSDNVDGVNNHTDMITSSARCAREDSNIAIKRIKWTVKRGIKCGMSLNRQKGNSGTSRIYTECIISSFSFLYFKSLVLEHETWLIMIWRVFNKAKKPWILIFTWVFLSNMNIYIWLVKQNNFGTFYGGNNY